MRILSRLKFPFSVWYLVVLAVIAVLAPWVTPYPQDAQNAMHFEQKLLPPSLTHPFGTDALGRDVFTLVLFGARLSLITAISVVGLALVIGVPLGLIAGFKGGWLESIIMRICDVFLAFPPLLLPIVLTAALGPNLRHAIIAVAVSWFPWYTRILRSRVLQVRHQAFVQAARIAGNTDSQIMVSHILPNSIQPVMVQATLDMGYAILAVAGLSFIGFGAQPPAIEWGLMITQARSTFLDYWWTAFFPGMALFVTVLAFNLTGDWLRNLLDGTAVPGSKQKGLAE